MTNQVSGSRQHNSSSAHVRHRALCLAAALALSACDAGPRLVYVPATEQEVEVFGSASANAVAVGEPVVLYAKRRNIGEWKQVEKKRLAAGQCWMHAPPLSEEEQVSGLVNWIVHPSEGWRFSTDYRADRTREVIFTEPGTYTLVPDSPIWCRPGKHAQGQPLTIVVHAGRARP